MNFALYENLQSAIIAMNADGSILYFNRALRERLALVREDFIDTHVCNGPWAKSWPEMRPHLARALTELQQKGTTQGKVQTTWNGADLYIRYNGFTLPSQTEDDTDPCFIVEVHDITRRELDRQTTELRERRLHSLIEAIGIASSLVDDSGTVLEANDRYVELTGRPREEVIGHSFHEWVSPRDTALVDEVSLSRPHKPVIRDIEIAFRHPDGTEVEVEANVQMIPQLDGGFLSRSLIQDITQRKRYLQAQEDARARLELILGSSPNAVALIDMETMEVTFTNDRANELFELADGEALEAPFTRFVENKVELERLRRKLAIDRRLTAQEVAIKSGKGNIVPTLLSAVLIGEPDSQFGVVTLEDLTVVNRVRENLRQSEEGLRAVVDATPMPMVVTNRHSGEVLYSNALLSELLKLPPEESLSGSLALPFYQNSADRERLVPLIENQGLVRNFTFQLTQADGEIADIELSACATNYQGIPVFVATLNDATQRLQATKALEDDRLRLETILDTLPVGITIRRGSDGVITYINERACEIHGHPHEELFGSVNSGFADDPDIAISFARELVEHGHFDAMEVPFAHASGKQSTVIVSGASFHTGDDTDILIAIQDISDRKAMETALRDSEERFRAIIDSTPHGIIIRSLDDLAITYINPRGVELLGFTAEEMTGEKSFDFVLEVDQAMQANVLAELAATGRFQAREVTYQRKDGTTFPAIISGVAVEQTGEQAEERQIIVSFEDITPLHRANADLQLSESKFSSLFQQSAIATQLYRPDGSLEMWNEASERVWHDWGLTPDDLRNHNILGDIRALGLGGLLTAEIFDGRASLGEDVVQYNVQDYFPHATRGVVHLAPRVFAISDHTGEVTNIVVTYLDITARIEAEEKLRQSQKMEAIGQLTGGIAHDFNNILAIIQGNLDLLQEKLSAGGAEPAFSRYVGVSIEAAERAATLTQWLLAFSRKQELQPEIIEPNTIIHGMADLLKRSLGEHITLDILCTDDIGNIDIDILQLETGLLNLAINARDAMPQGGTLTINTELAAENGDTGITGASQHEPHLVLSVSDTGHGMDTATISKSTEPFFTTKEVGQGSGLGLSMVEGFVNQSGGKMRIESVVGEGTTVKLFFPLCGQPRSSAEAEHIPQNAPGGSETILLVEDDASVHQLVSEMLTLLGYHVLSARDGYTALDMLDTHSDIDLLFTDLVLPNGLNGKQVAEAACSRRPDMKIIFASGYADNILSEAERAQIGIPLISKPFRKAALAQLLRETLEA